MRLRAALHVRDQCSGKSPCLQVPDGARRKNRLKCRRTFPGSIAKLKPYLRRSSIYTQMYSLSQEATRAHLNTPKAKAPTVRRAAEQLCTNAPVLERACYGRGGRRTRPTCRYPGCGAGQSGRALLAASGCRRFRPTHSRCAFAQHRRDDRVPPRRLLEPVSICFAPAAAALVPHPVYAVSVASTCSSNRRPRHPGRASRPRTRATPSAWTAVRSNRRCRLAIPGRRAPNK